MWQIHPKDWPNWPEIYCSNKEYVAKNMLSHSSNAFTLQRMWSGNPHWTHRSTLTQVRDMMINAEQVLLVRMAPSPLHASDKTCKKTALPKLLWSIFTFWLWSGTFEDFSVNFTVDAMGKWSNDTGCLLCVSSKQRVAPIQYCLVYPLAWSIPFTPLCIHMLSSWRHHRMWKEATTRHNDG